MQPDPPDRAIAALQLIAAEGFDVILVGAVARELVFDRKLGDRPHRATRDLDTAVRTETWDRYEDLAAKLTAILGFRRVENDGLRFVHEDGTELDVLPYGAILDHEERLRWPRDSTRTMSMRAFNDLDVRAAKSEYVGIVVRVPTLSDLVAQKLVAFEARCQETSKDLEDLVFMLSEATNALAPGIYDDLAPVVLERMDYEDLGPYRIGRAHARAVGPDRAADLASIIQNRILVGPEYVALGRVVAFDGLESVLARFAALRAGLLDDEDQTVHGSSIVHES